MGSDLRRARSTSCLDARTREAGTSGEGIINTIFNDWLNFETSPATFILAVIIIVVIFVAPFGIVGLLKRIARCFVVIVPTPGRHAGRRSRSWPARRPKRSRRHQRPDAPIASSATVLGGVT